MKESKESTFISLAANHGKEEELANFLVAGASIVKETEPDTLLWSALQLDEKTFAIFDTYPHPEGRDAHFGGKVAAALNEKAATLINGGWEDGVIKNVENTKILAAKVAPVLPSKIERAMYIRFTANEGKADDLAQFLVGGAAIIEESEPKTLYWYALRIDSNTFGIFDFFTDQSGIDAHFSGSVAAAFSEKASELVKGGWEEGVVNNVRQFDVLTVIAQ